jgi:cytidylate kinase
MAIISISRGTFSGGQSLAECVAGEMGYRCLPRVALYQAVSRYGISEEMLSKAISEAPGLWNRWSSEKARYLACARAALINEVKNDNVVYHGLAGHFLLQGVPHVIKVRVIADMEFRIKAAMERGHLTRTDAIQFIKTVDEKRARWTRFLYHVDWADPSLYDIVINLNHISLSSACEVVRCTARLGQYKATPESQKITNDLVLSSHVRALIAADKNISDHDIEVEADAGVVTIGGTVEWAEDVDKIEKIVSAIPGVVEVVPKMRVRLGWGDAEGLRMR